MAKKKTFIEDIERTLYDIKNEDRPLYRTEEGLTEAIVRDISAKKHDPKWMLDFRLQSLEVYRQTPLPTWGPDLSALDMDHIVTYVQPDARMAGRWEDVPEDIRDTFDRLGIPEAEKSSLAGVGAQYDSEVVYHSVQESLKKQGVVYTDMETALREHEAIVREYFMKLVPPKDHKFVALHGAVWSGGSFVYVPAGVEVKIPLQSYFRLNAPGAGQFEHTLIIVEPGGSLHFIEGCSAPKYNVTNLHAGCVELYIKEGARLRYSTIENWSRNMMNLNTKRALVEKDGLIEWVSGSFGSHVSMLYPSSILHGEGARCEFTGVTFAGHGQHLDTADRAPALDDPGDIVDVLRVVRQVWNQHEPGPDLDPFGCQTVTEGDGRGQGAPRHLLVGLLVTALDVEQDQVDVVEHLVAGIGPQEPGGVDARVNAHLLGTGQEPAREGGLHEDLAA